MAVSPSELSRQRIDYVTEPDGKVRAILTVTLPGGIMRRFDAVVDPADLSEVSGTEIIVGLLGIHVRLPKFLSKAAAFAKKLATNPRGTIMTAVNKLGHVKILGIPIGVVSLQFLADEAARKGLGKDLYHHLEALGPNGIPGSPAHREATGFVAKLAPRDSRLEKVAIKALATKATGPRLGSSAAKTLAHSKALATAAGSLASVIPFASAELRPALILAAGTMGVTSKLSRAQLFAHHGAHAEAKALSMAAYSDATRITSSPAAAKGLLQIANTKRLALARHAGIPASPRVQPAAARRAPSNPLTAAQAGHLRSNQGGLVTAAELLSAHATGRIFWVI
jgi:hypothetical protein